MWRSSTWSTKYCSKFGSFTLRVQKTLMWNEIVESIRKLFKSDKWYKLKHSFMKSRYFCLIVASLGSLRLKKRNRPLAVSNEAPNNLCWYLKSKETSNLPELRRRTVAVLNSFSHFSCSSEKIWVDSFGSSSISQNFLTIEWILLSSSIEVFKCRIERVIWLVVYPSNNQIKRCILKNWKT